MEHVSDDRRRSSSRPLGLRDTRRQDDFVEPNSGSSSIKGEEVTPSAASASGALKPRRTLSSTTLHCPRLLCYTSGADGGRPLEFVRKLSRSRGRLSATLDSEARHAPRVLATNAKGSISSVATTDSVSSVTAEAESVQSILSSKAVRLMEELLKPPSLRQAQSQQALRGAEQSTPASGGEPKPSAVGAEGLYIFSSSHRHTACYMYRTENGDPQDLYGFEHVPVRAIHGCGGRPAYLLAMSEKDPTVDSLRYKCTFSAPKAEASLARANSTASAPPGGLGEAVGYGFGGETEPASHADGCVPKFIEEGVAHAVIDKVRSQLRNTSRRLASLALGDTRHKEAMDDILYLVSDKDIVDFVSQAFAELEQAEDARPSKRISARGCRTLSSSPSLPMLNSQCNMITPCLAAAADPATTISVPRASFSNSGRPEGGSRAGTRCPDASTKATVVSRQSATEIVWMEDGADRRQSAPKRASGTDPGLVCKGYSSPLGELLPVSGPVGDGSPSDGTVSAPSALGGREVKVKVTSFPALQPRHCTNEWLKPPVEMDQLSKACPPDFYRMGVDAHGGAGASDSWPGGVAQEPVVNTLHCDHSLFGENPFYGDGLSAERQPTRRPSSTTANKRLGTWIGSASHRRRTTQAVDTRSWQGEPASNGGNSGPVPSFLDKLRWNGQSIFHRHDECPAPPTTPESPARGIRETRARGAGRRCDTCSEDNRPHVCEDDLDSNSGGVSSTG